MNQDYYFPKTELEWWETHFMAKKFAQWLWGSLHKSADQDQ